MGIKNIKKGMKKMKVIEIYYNGWVGGKEIRKG